MTNKETIETLNANGYKAEEIIAGTINCFHPFRANKKVSINDWMGELTISTTSSNWSLEHAKQFAIELQEAIELLEKISS